MSPSLIVFSATLLVVPTLASVAAGAESYGVFKSADRGRSWVRSDRGIPDESRVNAFGSQDETLFAGTDSGIFISRDEAESWRPATGVAITSGRILSFAALEGKVFAGADGSGVLVSADEGETWALNSAFPSIKVRCLLVHQGNVYAGTDADGAFVSRDVGESWIPLRQDFPARAQVFALAVVEDTLFAGLYSKGLYAWNNRENRWTKAGPVSPLVLETVAGTLIAGHNPGGLFWSADLGATWSKGTASSIAQFPSVRTKDAGELSSEAPVWELASDDEIVFAGASTGIFYSEDGGRTWARARTGLPAESPGVSFLVKPAFVLAGIPIKSAPARD